MKRLRGLLTETRGAMVVTSLLVLSWAVMTAIGFLIWIALF
jgi:hypothetical protein